MSTADIRMPAEWEPVSAVIVAWPHAATDWNYMLADIRACYADIIAAIAARAQVIIIGPEAPADTYLPADAALRANIRYVAVDTNDTWTRDFGPIATADNDGKLYTNDFCFNGWGLKFAANFDNLVTGELSARGILTAPRINRLGFVLEGGSIESDGAGTILTTAECLLSPNRNGDLDTAGIEAYLRQALGAKHILWLHYGALEGDDTDGHIDTLCRLAPPGDVIFYTGCTEPDDCHYPVLKMMRHELEELRTPAGMPYHLIELPLPDAIYDPDEGIRLPATYANFLIVNGTVLLPTYGQPMKDLMAQMAIKAAMPQYDVVPIDCRALIRQHGSLHCATMQIPKSLLNVE